eukprot:64429-Rhodomonas_salina.1
MSTDSFLIHNQKVNPLLCSTDSTLAPNRQVDVDWQETFLEWRLIPCPPRSRPPQHRQTRKPCAPKLLSGTDCRVPDHQPRY